jgi:hypothetical protein
MAGPAKSRGYVQEWMESVQLRQTDLVNMLGYSKAKANAIWHGEQRLNEDILEQIAALVNAKPYELLMTPAEAMKVRRIRAIVDDALRPVETPEPPAETTPRHARKAS